MRTALFPGSFDPFTIGHYEVLESALKIVDKVNVAVGYNSAKKGFFAPQTRVEIIKQATAHLPNVEVCSYSGLTIDACRNLGASVIVRGLRTTADFEMESVIAQANTKLAPEISTVFLPACGEYSFVSSTIVRDVLIHKGDVSQFLPKGVQIEKFYTGE